MYSKF